MIIKESDLREITLRRSIQDLEDFLKALEADGEILVYSDDSDYSVPFEDVGEDDEPVDLDDYEDEDVV